MFFSKIDSTALYLPCYKLLSEQITIIGSLNIISSSKQKIVCTTARLNIVCNLHPKADLKKLGTSKDGQESKVSKSNNITRRGRRKLKYMQHKTLIHKTIHNIAVMHEALMA